MFKKNRKSRFLRIFLFGVIFFIFFGSYLVIANFEVFPASYNVLEDYNSFYNFSINNSDALKNITQLNISFPNSFVLVSGSFNCSRNAFFVNTSNLLSWFNNSENSYLIPNGSIEYFWFNASAQNPGFYNLSITALYNDNSLENYNISFRVNDTTLPYVSIVFPENNSVFRTNVSVPLNFSFLDNGIISDCWYSLDNSANISFDCGYNLTLNLSDESFHTLRAYANDSYNNLNSSFVSFFVDSLSPRITLSLDSSNATFLSFHAEIQDASYFVNGSVCNVNRNNAQITSNWTRRNITENGLSCGNSYFYNVSCYDYAGNFGSASNTFSTSACSSTEGSNSGSNSNSNSQNNSFVWKFTFIADLEKLGSNGYNGVLGLLERVKLKMANGEEHYVGVLNVSNESVRIEVASYPQEAELKIGETKKFEVTEDNFYDLNITLNNISNKKANLTIIPILEAMNLLSEDSNKDSSSLKSNRVFLGEEDDFENFVNKKSFIWVIIGLVVVVAGVGATILIRKKIMVKKRGH